MKKLKSILELASLIFFFFKLTPGSRVKSWQAKLSAWYVTKLSLWCYPLPLYPLLIHFEFSPWPHVLFLFNDWTHFNLGFHKQFYPLGFLIFHPPWLDYSNDIILFLFWTVLLYIIRDVLWLTKCGIHSQTSQLHSLRRKWHLLWHGLKNVAEYV